MKLARTCALGATATLLCESTQAASFSVDLKQTTGEGKHTYLADRSINKRSSDHKPAPWTYFTHGVSETLFGKRDTRTDFDRKIDEFISRQQYLAEKKHRKSSKSKNLQAGQID